MGRRRRKSSRKGQEDDSFDPSEDIFLSKKQASLHLTEEKKEKDSSYSEEKEENIEAKYPATEERMEEENNPNGTPKKSKKKGGCHFCHEEGHVSKACPERKQKRKNKMNCHICGEKGHTQRECPGLEDGGRRQCRASKGTKKKGSVAIKKYQNFKEIKSQPKTTKHKRKNHGPELPSFEADYLDIFCNFHALQSLLKCEHLSIQEMFEELRVPMNLKGCITSLIVLDEEKETVNTDLLKEEILWGTIGVLPLDPNMWNEEIESFIHSNLSNPKIVALGVIGLDYTSENFVFREKQLEACIKQIHIAEIFGKSVMITCSNGAAQDDFFQVIENEAQPSTKICLFNCECEPAKLTELVRRREHTYVGFTGKLTFSKEIGLHELAFDVPLNKILIGTASPDYLPSQIGGGKGIVCHPGHLVWIADKIASEKQLTIDEILNAVRENTKTFFGI